MQENIKKIKNNLYTYINNNYYFIIEKIGAGRSSFYKITTALTKTLTKEELKELKKHFGFFDLRSLYNNKHKLIVEVSTSAFSNNIKKCENIINQLTELLQAQNYTSASFLGNVIESPLKLAQHTLDYVFISENEFRLLEKQNEAINENIKQTNENYLSGFVASIAVFLVLTPLFWFTASIPNFLLMFIFAIVAGISALAYEKFAKKIGVLSIVIHLILSVISAITAFIIMLSSIIYNRYINAGYIFTIEEFIPVNFKLISTYWLAAIETVAFLIVGALLGSAIVLSTRYTTKYKAKTIEWIEINSLKY